jgi:soluble calcium-activated nucleotidase 1
MIGSGDEKFKGFKSEWATIKGNELIVGSHGKKPEEEWHPQLQKWLFFPRKISNQAFEPQHDENCCGSNKLFIVSEDFSDIQIIEVGEAIGERGVSSFKILPGFPNECVALKSVEVGNRTETFFFAFDLQGNVLHADTLIGHYKVSVTRTTQPAKIIDARM